jgi:AcrR family transcriptional regulator
MPPAFTAEEKARITGLLLESGRALFTTRGLRKTSLDELVAPAAIAKSSFYAFFSSKEALYLELMRRQMAEVKRRVIDEGLLTSPDDTREALRRFLRATLDELVRDPLYGRLMTHPEEMDAVVRKQREQGPDISADNPAVAMMEFVSAKRDEGELLQADTSVIVGALQAVLLFPTYADRLVAPDLADQVKDLLIDAVATALAPKD